MSPERKHALWERCLCSLTNNKTKLPPAAPTPRDEDGLRWEHHHASARGLVCPPRAKLRCRLRSNDDSTYPAARDSGSGVRRFTVLCKMVSLLWGCLLIVTPQVCWGQGGNGLLSRSAAHPSARQQYCTWPCRCGARVQCDPGVSAVLDGCGCCKSCARQIGESCNERDVCDPHKGMYCDFSRDQPRYELGICAYMMAVGCDLNGAHYDNGQAFQPNPLYKCTCIAGAIGCTPAFIQKPAAMLGAAPLQRKKPAGLRAKNPQDTTYRTMSGEAGGHHLQDHVRDPPLVWRKTCEVQTTPWAPCTHTCGLGLSTRVSNNNRKCQMRKERRLCLLRPCEKNTLKNIKIPAGKTCKATFQVGKAEPLRLSGCTSTQKYRPTYCGVCTDKRCCVPNKSRVVQMEFRCPGGTKELWKMQWITSC
ncbi:hypothetical protein P4O66_019869, partial [Electrophorus voltai]